MNSLKTILKRMYRSTFKTDKIESVVWNDLKQLFKSNQWRYGIFETDRMITATFEIAENRGSDYYIAVYDNYIHFRVKVIENFDPERTVELFILAAHFNNLLNHGTVVVNVESNYVEYHLKCDTVLALHYTDALYFKLTNHYNTSKDIYWGFHQLVEMNEEPVFIISEILKKNSKE